MTTKLTKNRDSGKCIAIGSSDPLPQVLWGVDVVVAWIRDWIKVRMTDRPCHGASITPSLPRLSTARKFPIRKQWLKHSLHLAQALRNL